MHRTSYLFARSLKQGLALLLAIWTMLASHSSYAESAVAEAPAQPGGQVEVEADTKTETMEWVRLRKDAKQQPVALEVAVVRYAAKQAVGKDPAKVTEYVDLIGAIHVGDLSYYEALNTRFRSYDALLYELVAPEGTIVEKGRGTSNSNPLGALQNGMKSMLKLEHQLEKVDYTPTNFVHADLSPEDFMKSMKDKDEGFMKMYFRMMGQAMAQQSAQAAKGESTDMDMLVALFSKDRPRQLKIAFAKQFASMGNMLDGISGSDGSTLITERNKRALEVLSQELTAGKRKIGIFYGAGHMNDMHERMLKEFQLVPISTVWIEAWNLRP